MEKVVWKVLLRVGTKPQRESMFTLEIDHHEPRYSKFKQDIATYFSITYDFYFVDKTYVEVDKTNILNESGKENAILGIQRRGKPLASYTFPIHLVPSELFKRDQQIRYSTASALCEFIDNSIQYTLGNQGERRITVSKIDSGSGELTIKDNGVGMDIKRLLNFGKISEKGYEEDCSAPYVVDTKEQSKIHFLDEETKHLIIEYAPQLFSSFLSKWGIGAKIALQKLGAVQTVSSTVRGSPILSHIKFQPPKEGSKPWAADLVTETIPEQEHRAIHFTQIKIHALSKFDPPFDISDDTALRDYLSHIYYFYSNGWNSFFDLCFTTAREHAYCHRALCLKSILSFNEKFRTVKIEYNRLSLKPDPVMGHYSKGASVFPFYFTFTMKPPTTSRISGVEGKYCKHIAAGFVFYFPYKEEELLPEGSRRTEYYWLGRLLPEEDMILSFMDQENYKQLPHHFIRRTKAIVFLNRAFVPTPEKNRLLNDGESVSELLALSSDKKLQKCFKDWVLDCHKEFDKELMYTEFISAENLPGLGQRFKYKCLETMEKAKVMQGDFVVLKSRSQKKKLCVYGTVKHFEYVMIEGQPKRDQKVFMNPLHFVWLKPNHYLIEEYEISCLTQQEAKKIQQDLIREFEPQKILVFEAQKGRRVVKQDKAISNYIVSTTEMATLQVYLFNMERTVEPSMMVMDWELVGAPPTHGEKNIKTAKKYFEITFKTLINPIDYTLRIKVRLPNAKEDFAIVARINVNIISAPVKEIIFTSLPPTIRLGTPITSPIFQVVDEVGVPYFWTKDTPSFPQVKIKKPFCFAKDVVKAVEYDIQDTTLECRIPHIELEEGTQLSDCNMVTLVASFNGVCATVHIPVLAGVPISCDIKLPQDILNAMTVPISFQLKDLWHNPTTCDSLELQEFKEMLPPVRYHVTETSMAGQYSMKSSLFRQYFANGINHEITVFGKPVCFDNKSFYNTFAIGETVFQTGDYFSMGGTKNVPKLFGMIYYVYISDATPEDFMLYYLWVDHPRCVPKDKEKFFEGQKWRPNELCMTDFHCGPEILSKLSNTMRRIHVLSRKQFEKFPDQFKESDSVYFIDKTFSWFQYSKKSTEKNYFYSLRGGNEGPAKMFTVGGSNGIHSLHPNKKHFRAAFQPTLFAALFHESSVQWVINGKPTTLQWLEENTKIAMKPGNFIYCIPTRGFLDSETNLCISLQLNVKTSTKFLIAHKRLCLLPSVNASNIDIMVRGVENSISFSKSSLRGMSGSEVKIEVRVLNDAGTNMVHDVSNVTIQIDSRSTSFARVDDLFFSTVQMPTQLKKVDTWFVIVSLRNGNRIQRELFSQSSIGLPHRLCITKIAKGEEPTKEVIPSSEGFSLQCGRKYLFFFEVLDKSNNTYKEEHWLRAKLSLRDVQPGKIDIHGAGSPSLEIDQKSFTSTFPPSCMIRIIAGEGEIKFSLTAELESVQDSFVMDSEILRSFILPGRPTKICVPDDLPSRMNTYEELVINAQLQDEAENIVEDPAILLRITRPNWDINQSQLDFERQSNGWYSKGITIKKAGIYNVRITALDQKRRGNTRRNEIQEYGASIVVSEANNIASKIFISPFREINSGEKLDIQYYATTSDNTRLEVPVIVHIAYGVMKYTLNDPLIDVGEYELVAMVDKDYTVKREALCTRRKFLVISGTPKKMAFEPSFEQAYVLNQEKQWIWESYLNVSLKDESDNTCHNVSPDTSLTVVIRNQQDNQSIYCEQFQFRNGIVRLLDKTFIARQFQGIFSIVFSVDYSDRHLSKSVDFTTQIMDKRALVNQKKYLEIQLREKEKRLHNLKFDFDAQYPQAVWEKKLREMDNLTNKLRILEGEREGISRTDTKYKKAILHIEKMPFFPENKDCFLGNVSSLAYVGPHDGWTDEQVRDFNIQLTNWIGFPTLAAVVLYCKDRSYEETLITRIHSEIRSGRPTGIKIKIVKLQDEKRVSKHPQQHISLDPIRFTGFLGYAINLLFLDGNQLAMHLRDRLWSQLLRETMVFDTTENLSNFCKTYRNSIHAFTLDGTQRRGNIIDLQEKQKDSRQIQFAFEKPPNSSQRDELRKKKQNHERYLSARQTAQSNLQRVQKETNDIRASLAHISSSIPQEERLGELVEALEYSISAPTDPRLRSIIRSPSPSPPRQGIQANAFDRKPKAPSKRPRPANRGRIAAKRGKYR